MHLEIKTISVSEKKAHLNLIKKNQKSEARRIDPTWRQTLNTENYETWLETFSQQGSKGIYLENKIIGEVIFYIKENKTFFGMWIDEDFMNKGLGQRVFKEIQLPPNVYVEFLNSNERVNHLLLKHKFKPQIEGDKMKICKIS